MKSAIVTGASSGIGLEISKSLISSGFKVFGVARDFKKVSFKDDNFITYNIDLTKKSDIIKLHKSLQRESIDILVNSAGVATFALHKDIPLEDIDSMLNLNLKAPLYLTKLFLQTLIKNRGYIFNINSISGSKPATHGCVYGATKAGLKHFGTSLFAEMRKSGIKVVNIEPDITKTPWFDDKNFSYYNDPQNYIEPSDIAKVILDLIDLRDGTVITDIVIQPQKFRLD
jgi:short-subunit dehydrogenase